MGRVAGVRMTCSAWRRDAAYRRWVSMRRSSLGAIAGVCCLVPALPAVASAQTSTPPALLQVRIGVISPVGRPAGNLLVRYSWHGDTVSKRIDGAGEALDVPQGTVVHLAERANRRCRCVFH